MSRARLFLSAGIAGAILAIFNPPNQRGPRPPLVMISIDGLRADYLTEADAHGLEIPNLRRLMKDGAYASGVRGVIPTITYPSHATLVTGVSPAKHGIWGNGRFDPLRKNNGGWYWYAEDLEVPTLWDVAAKAGRTSCTIQWPVTVNAPNVTWNIPEIWHAGDRPDDRKLVRALATKGLLWETAKLGEYPGGAVATLEADSIRTGYAEWILEHKRPDLLFIHLIALDEVEHQNGPFTPHAIETLERLDAMVGRLRAAADKVSKGKGYLTVVSDHGFVPFYHQLNLVSAFREAKLFTVDEKTNAVTDWKAMPWSLAGSFAVMVKDSTDTATVRIARELLDKLAADTTIGIDRIIEGKELRTMAMPAAFWVGLKPGWRTGSSLTGPVFGLVDSGGTHGHSPDLRELWSTFVVVGPRVPAGLKLGPVDIRDIAPTMASLIGLELPLAEGKKLLK